ncbi:hypothetical protein [Agrobacterium sp. B1(2019)]|uniref:hypothetical protein n=1 Tax=Agrobacterium sp. B1(2019) TaxID=2607032 RepID=UPI0011EDC240|nr:hypothetical protein [Agrobacterium sp. B1(2019)]TZG36615.1 hypothetical protein AGR1_03715 [Agrobacterium sp. B1(2019)]
MYSFRDRSKKAQKYRVRQMSANIAISGRDMRDEDILHLETWIDEGVSQDEVARRLIVRHIGGDTTAEKVENLRRYYKIKRSSGYPEQLADALNRIEGIEGDETLSLIADLLRKSILTPDEANAFTLMHVREKSR